MPPLFMSRLSSDHVGTPVAADNWTVPFLLFVKSVFSWLHQANDMQPLHPLHVASCLYRAFWLASPTRISESMTDKNLHTEKELEICVPWTLAMLRWMHWCAQVNAGSLALWPLHLPFSPAVSLKANEQKQGRCVHVNRYLVRMQPCS